jgi:serine protease Do
MENKMKTSIYQTIVRARAFLIGSALAVCVWSGVAGHLAKAAETEKITKVALTVNDAPPNHDSPGNQGSYAPVVKHAAQSVVRVDVESKSRAPQMQSPLESDDFLHRFFGDQFQQKNGRPFKMPKQKGLGSGVILTKDGYILTNNHVVEQADVIRVTLNDGREFPAKVIGRDPNTDIAVLKVEGKDLPTMTITDSDKTEVGDVCLAIGNPFGIGQTVTMGIVSAIGRWGVELGTDYEDFIQTDAAINPGNSGGALVDSQGRLIGINTAILSRSGGYQGIGFAIPINLARTVMESLIAHGKVIRGFIGVAIQDVTPILSEKLEIPGHHGALVSEVTENSPAEKAGLQSGDVVVDFNGKTIMDSRNLKLQVAQTAPGSTVPIKIIRDGRGKDLTVTIKERSPSEGERSTGNKDPNEKSDDDTLNGVGVEDLNSQARTKYNIPAGITGALVVDVEEESAAHEAGLQIGDVIQEINRTKVTTADEAVKLTQHPKDKVALLKIWSKGNTRYMVVDESKPR